ncbi:nucleotidyl transferase AbiEii/AbiGii toxin family protein [Herbiconiux sp. CPCC 203407]|uniref:Nucleotidyl transferase AbiEii/AbiGii toxin family protein n=1 Tax=Herbiconiux oxytropis TaxID=2970915 RepID=A0AA41XAP3_9MICO|nr:nucleotidyl transferase AbiEii/AbiGii toxin family protein [Herbiconiux oxytropis]MCS5721055.1 nucleotidyl transferase AbiEii/AbiGii toxin family protein [Herbiconiux oxytropis]MCS5724707.1 nucleotidyl transferase AbiEii/AbiGii toxin family protein [Herbiconiux oxytropis]
MAHTKMQLASLARSLQAKLNNEARRRGVTADVIRKQYIFTVFLSRLFSPEPQAPWVLLGGNALLIRTGGGRFTQDIDLARESEWASSNDVRAELQSLADASADRDPFTFVVVAVEPHSEPDPFDYGAKTAKARVQALLGAQVFDTFTIDLTERRHLDAPVDQVPLRAVIEHDTLSHLPSVPTTPLENHLADKVCAMYERHGRDGDSPSTRYRDLADIVRILDAGPIDTARLKEVLDRESGRRRITLPSRMEAPAEEWRIAFPRQARTFAEYSSKLYELDASLDETRPCLDPILSGKRTSGTWVPEKRAWSD